MEPRFWSNGRIRLAITTVALGMFALHVFAQRWRLDLTGDILLFMASLPWLLTLVMNEELHLSCNLRQTTSQSDRRRQASEHAALKFLLTFFLPEQENVHLERLASENGGRTRRRAAAGSLRMELRRLKTLGLIEGLPQKGMPSFLKSLAQSDQSGVELKEHFRITQRGREYLALRREMLGASDPFSIRNI